MNYTIITTYVQGLTEDDSKTGTTQTVRQYYVIAYTIKLTGSGGISLYWVMEALGNVNSGTTGTPRAGM